ncbi:MAG: hypothetical protein HOE69_03245 [Euryarchaeota archaeon]|jgi:hypothetical protein|nr:hypothetical protein [Euryarchaeota archaeon]
MSRQGRLARWVKSRSCNPCREGEPRMEQHKACHNCNTVSEWLRGTPITHGEAVSLMRWISKRLSQHEEWMEIYDFIRESLEVQEGQSEITVLSKKIELELDIAVPSDVPTEFDQRFQGYWL